MTARLEGDRAELRVDAHDALYGDSTLVTGRLSRPFLAVDPRFTLAARGVSDVHTADGYARGRGEAHFTGKLANPFLLHGQGSAFDPPTDAGSIDRLVAARGGPPGASPLATPARSASSARQAPGRPPR